jgi:hypothetical protein
MPPKLIVPSKKKKPVPAVQEPPVPPIPPATLRLATTEEMSNVTTRLPDELFTKILQFMPPVELKKYKRGTGAFGYAARHLIKTSVNAMEKAIIRVVNEPIRNQSSVASADFIMINGRKYSVVRQLNPSVRILGGPTTAHLMIASDPHDGGQFVETYTLTGTDDVVASIVDDLIKIMEGFGEAPYDIVKVSYTVIEM